MKKLSLIILMVILACSYANAQKLQGVKNFLGSTKYEIVVGYGSSVTSEPFDCAKLGLNLGVTARKSIKSFKNDKFDIYGLIGVFLTSRGGKTDDDFMTLGDDTKNFSTSDVSIPIHAGGEYKFGKVSLFVDLGPHVLINTGVNDIENVLTKKAAFGAGFNIGVRFKRFALSMGFDKEFTKLATFIPSYEQKEALKLDKVIYDLKTAGVNINLRWTIGKL